MCSSDLVLADGRPNWSVTASGQRSRVSVESLARTGDLKVDTLVVRNGTVTFRDAGAGTLERVTGLNATVTARSLSGPFLADGTFAYRGVPARFALNSSAVVEHRHVGLRLELTLADSDKVDLRGTLSEPSAKGVFTGTVAVDGTNLAAAAERWRKAFQSASVTPVFAVPFHLGAQTTLALAEADRKSTRLNSSH